MALADRSQGLDGEPLHTTTMNGPQQRVALRFEGISKAFGGVDALKAVTLEVHRGEVHAIVGENGAGKSTLMAIAAGELGFDAGRMQIGASPDTVYSPERVRELGLAIVHQESALIPDLTIAENLRAAVPTEQRPAWSELHAWAGSALRAWPGRQIDPRMRASDLSRDAQSVVEIIKATLQLPEILLLDEPTANFSTEDSAYLFKTIRTLRERGCAVVYISHRLTEVQEIANRITVLRDGETQATFSVGERPQSEIVRLMVGRPLDVVFPPKAEALSQGQQKVALSVGALSGQNFRNITFTVNAGEIVGIAGVEGNGQRDVLRALAGLHPSSGEVRIRGAPARLGTTATARSAGIAYIPRDRRAEGALTALSVRENITTPRIELYARLGFVSGRRESKGAAEITRRFNIKAPSSRAPIEALSGGNQQKVIIGRMLQDKPEVILADEPTQGVDVGARTEIYRMLRRAVEQGSGVLTVCADFAELSGLCDRVLVMSRGRVIEELEGDAVTEARIVEAAVTGGSARDELTSPRLGHTLWRRVRIPWIVLLLAVVALGIDATRVNSAYLSQRSLSGLLTWAAIAGFVALGQQLAMLIGAIDLSVGPLMGTSVVVASFVIPDGRHTTLLVLGFLALVALAATVGALNWTLSTIVNIPPLIATLVLYTALQGLSLLLRPLPGGTINIGVVSGLQASVAFVPVAAIVCVLLAVAFEIGLARSTLGNEIRAVGSRADAARRLGIRVGLVSLWAYIGTSVLALLGGLLLMAQVQTGDPTVGTEYTLISITAVLVGGASVFGGRGSFVGALLGALLVQQINTVTGFLHLSIAWQLYLLGGLTLVAVAVYSNVETGRSGPGWPNRWASERRPQVTSGEGEEE